MRKLRLSALLLLLLASFVVVGCSDDDDGNPVASTQPTSQVRVIHASFDAPDVDIAVDGTVAINGLGFGSAAPFAAIPAGTRNIRVTPENATTPVVINVDLTLQANTDYTVLAVDSLGSIEPVFDVDDRTPTANKAKVRFIHASPDAPPVDIKLNDGSGATVFGHRAFKSISDYIEVDGGTYTFAVTGAGTTSEVVVFDPVTVTNGAVYTIVALGTLDTGDSSPFFVRVFVDGGAGDVSLDLSPTI